jgi:hypothetical protein
MGHHPLPAHILKCAPAFNAARVEAGQSTFPASIRFASFSPRALPDQGAPASIVMADANVENEAHLPEVGPARVERAPCCAWGTVWVARGGRTAVPRGQHSSRRADAELSAGR